MKKRMNHSLLLMILFPLLIGESAPKRPMQPEDLMQIRRISDPRISPDGKRIAYTLATPDLLQNKISSDIWYIPISGGASKQLTISPFDDHSPCWSPDGKTIAFLSDRNGPKNLFLIPVNGGEARQLTFSKTDLYQPVWSKDGKTILCGSRILPEGKTDVENPTKDQLPKCTARTINKLPYRHWDTWLGDERNHVFLVNISDGQMTDLTPGDNDTPPVSLSGNRDFDISPDGNYIAYVAMSKPGYESDRTQLIIYNRKNNRVNPLSDKLDRSVEEVGLVTGQ